MGERYELPGLSTREMLESMGPEGLTTYILSLGEQVTKIENDMNLASVVLEGAYGVTVEQVLANRDRENKNGERT